MESLLILFPVLCLGPLWAGTDQIVAELGTAGEDLQETEGDLTWEHWDAHEDGGGGGGRRGGGGGGRGGVRRELTAAEKTTAAKCVSARCALNDLGGWLSSGRPPQTPTPTT